jgi:hypothetical protein
MSFDCLILSIKIFNIKTNNKESRNIVNNTTNGLEISLICQAISVSDNN